MSEREARLFRTLFWCASMLSVVILMLWGHNNTEARHKSELDAVWSAYEVMKKHADELIRMNGELLDKLEVEQ